MRKGTIVLISFLLGLILVGGYIIFDSHQNTQTSTTYYSVTLNTEDKAKGTVKDLEEKEYKSGEKIVLRATPAEEYVFSGWYISNELISTQNPYTYEVKDNITIIAKFELEEVTETPETYIITLTASEGGTVTELEQTEYEINSKITLQATANEGYTFLGFYENTILISSENPCTYTVNKNVNIIAKFEVIETTEPQPTSAQYFTFDGESCTGYIGDPNVAEIIIPKSYSTVTTTESVAGAKVVKQNVIPTLTSFTSVTFCNENGSNLHTYTSASSLSSSFLNDFPDDDVLIVNLSVSFFNGNLKNKLNNILIAPFVASHTKDGERIYYETVEDYTNTLIATSYYSCFDDYKTITKYIDGNDYKVTNISATNNKSGFESFDNNIKLLSNITSISDGAFAYCYNLKSITISDSVTSIGDEAFRGCAGLTSVTIPEGVTSIGISTFDNCASLTSVTIPSSVTSIGDDAFKACYSLTSVSIPNSVNSIGYKAFADCYSLIDINVDDDNQNYSSDDYGVLFNKNKTELIQYSIGNTRLTYTIPSSVLNIKGFAFKSCSNLTSIEISNSLISIGEYAFASCRNLSSLEIPNTVTNIGDSAFSNCRNLTNILIPNSVTNIGNYAFSGCSSIVSMEISNTVTNIGDGVFSDCSSLISVTIPQSVTSIGNYAFRNCSNLTTMTILATTPPLLGNKNSISTSTTKIYIPTGMLTSYQTADVWSELSVTYEELSA